LILHSGISGCNTPARTQSARLVRDAESLGYVLWTFQLVEHRGGVVLDRDEVLSLSSTRSCWYTPLMHSLRYSQPRYDIAQLLLDHGVDPNETNGMGMTVLHIFHPDDEQWATPIAWARRRNHLNLVSLLGA
jgi:hypothetical protein